MSFYAVLIAAATLAAFVWALGDSDNAARAGTIAFVTLALAQAFHLGNGRSAADVLEPRRIIANPWAIGAVALVIGLQALAVYTPGLARVLRVVPLTGPDWVLILAAAAAPAAIGQAIRVSRRRNGRPYVLT